MEQRPSILVVDDEPQILRVLRASLPARGFEVRTADSGEEALEAIRKEIPDLVILDLVMPELSGLEVCREVRKISEVPIIVLSAKGSEKDKVIALEMGADDYVTKPFGMKELIARIRAVLRRSFDSELETTELTVGCISMDMATRRVLIRGKEVRLTPKEFDVLRYLLENAGKVVSHRDLLRAVWGWQSAEQTEYLRVFVNQLRKKMETDPQNPRYLLTEPWIGYRLVADK